VKRISTISNSELRFGMTLLLFLQRFPGKKAGTVPEGIIFLQKYISKQLANI